MDTDEFLGLVDSSGLNKVELANVLNLSRTTVYKWLAGNQIPKKYWSNIRTILRKSPEELKMIVKTSSNENSGLTLEEKTIVLDQGFLKRTEEVGELVMFLNKNFYELKNHSLFKLFMEKIEKEAIINYKEWLVKELNKETYTKEELIKKLLTKSS